MNINHLILFHAVARDGNISRAAERLCVSQPAISKQIAALERSLGTHLFDRLPKGMRLTEAGELLYSHSRRLFAIEAQAERALAELHGLQRGRLAIGASTTIGDYLLPEIIAQFHRQYPGVEVGLEIANTDTIQKRLLEGVLDVGMTEGIADDTELEAAVFAEDELVLIAPPTHPLTLEKYISAARVAQEPFIVREAGSGTRAVIERALAEKGLTLNIGLSLGSTEAIKRAVMAGAGVAIVSRLTIAEEEAAGRVRVLDAPDVSIRRSLHRLHVRGRHQGRAVTAFLAILNGRKAFQ